MNAPNSPRVILEIIEQCCELNYHDQKIRQTHACDIRKHWTAISTLFRKHWFAHLIATPPSWTLLLELFIFVYNLSRIRTPNVNRSNKKHNFIRTKSEKQTISCRNINIADYLDDQELLANTPAQAGSLLHDLKQAAGSISFDVNANKTEYIF